MRGRATGNVFNFADAGDDDDLETPVLRTGKVHIYNSLVDSIEVKPFRILKVDVQFTMAPILKSIAAKWSPIESMDSSCIPIIVYNIPMIETNPQISVYEQGEWTDKGRYEAAVSFDEDVEWIKKKKDYILPVCYVRYFYCLHQDYLIFISHKEQQPTFLPALSVSSSLGPTGTAPPETGMSTPPSVTGSPFKDKMIASFSIPLELTNHSDANLGYAWQKYKACLMAVKTCNMLWDTGKLRAVFDRKPTQADIVSIFKGKTQWHLTYSKAFPKLSGYPTMVSWLEDSDDKLSDIELWGIWKPAYAFSDLLEWLANGGEGLNREETEAGSDIGETQKAKGKGKGNGKGKGKGKGEGKGKGKGKEKEKEKEKEKGKGKEKEVTGQKKKKSKVV